MSTFWSYFCLEMRLNGRLLHQSLGIVFFFALMLFSGPFAFPNHPDIQKNLGGGLMILALIYTNALTLPRLLDYDFESGFLETIATTPRLSLEAALVAKLLVHFLFVGAPTLLLASLCAYGYDIAGGILGHFLIIFSLAITGIASMGIFISTLLIQEKNTPSLLCVLVFPFLLPLLIFASQAYYELLEMTLFGNAALCCVSLSLCYIPLAILGGAFALREAITTVLDQA